jgi:hypothetical protein
VRVALAGAAVVYHAASAPYDRWPKLLPPLMRGVLEGASASHARIVYSVSGDVSRPLESPWPPEIPAVALGTISASRSTR